jgi:hypothetical protein
MIEYMDQVPIFTNDKGEPYRLFIHKCPEKERIAEMIEVSERNLKAKFYVLCICWSTRIEYL